MASPRVRPAVLGVLLLAGACGGGGGAAPTPLPTPTPAESPSSFAYLQDVSAGSAVVAHVSSALDAYRVEWSLASGGPVLGRAEEAEPRRYHALRLTPLAPDSVYAYRLRTGAGSLLAEGRFNTPPPPRTRSVTFAVISDSGWPGGPEAQAAEAIRASSPPPELLLHAGDVIYPNGQRENYQPYLFEPFARVLDHMPLFPVLGNHDLETQSGQPWLDAFTTLANGPDRSERYYSLDWGDVHVLALDVTSTAFRRGSRQWAFADADLAAAAGAWKVVVVHYPPFSGGLSGGDPGVARELVPLFESRQVDVVLCGHDHGYQRFQPRRGVRYLVVAGGGASLDPIRPRPDHAFSRSAHHFLRGRADAATLLLEAVDLEGRVFDAVELRR